MSYPLELEVMHSDRGGLQKHNGVLLCIHLIIMPYSSFFGLAGLAWRTVCFGRGSHVSCIV